MSDDGDPAAEQPPTRDGDDQDGATAADRRTADADEAEADARATGDDHDRLPVEPAIAEQVADHDESLGEAVAALFETAADLAGRVDELEADLTARSEEVEDLERRLKRKQADFENYKKRREREEERIRERATEDLVDRLLDVRDDLVRAIESDHDDVEGLRDGVKMTLEEFDRVLDAENVAAIEPEPGDEVDPQRHEVMMRVESDRPEGTVAQTYESGYEMAGKVLRAAKVAVSEGGEGTPADGSDEATPEDGSDDETSEDGTGAGED